MATFVWRRFNQQYRLTVAEGPDGLHLRGGLVALTAEVIRPGRVQAVRLVEPLLWRPLGWCRLEVDIAGRQRRKGEGEAQRGQLHALVPVGTRSLGIELVDRLLPDRPRELSPPPRRVFWKSPFRYRALSWGRSEHLRRRRRAGGCAASRPGCRWRRCRACARCRGRCSGDSASRASTSTPPGEAAHATLRDRDAAEAAQALADLTDLARVARTETRARVSGIGAPGRGP